MGDVSAGKPFNFFEWFLAVVGLTFGTVMILAGGFHGRMEIAMGGLACGMTLVQFALIANINRSFGG